MAETTLADLVRTLHSEGKGRNDIARTLGVSGSTVSKAAREAGISFDRSITAAATEAKQIDAEAKRAELREKLLVKAERFLDAAEPDPDDLRGNVIAFGVLTDKYLGLMRFEAAAEAEATKASRQGLGQVDLWLNEILGNTGPDAPAADNDDDDDQETQ